MDIVLSIKPEYVEKIFNGSKKYEFRKRIPKKQFDKVYVYSSTPVKKIVGYFNVDYVIYKNPSQLWNETKSYAGIDKLRFDAYFEEIEVGYALHIKNTILFEHPIDPYKKYENFKAPQSYIYCNWSGLK